MFYPDDDRKLDRISARFTETEYEAVKDEAAALGLSLGGYVRKACLERHADDISKQPGPVSTGGFFVAGSQSARDICLAMATIITKMDVETEQGDTQYNEMARMIFARMQNGE